MKFNCQQNRRGFTLLEVMLALGLTVVVIGIVTMSVNGTLLLVDRGRMKTERDQLARAILTRIGDDVRGVVRDEPFDASGMMSVKTTSSSSSKSGGSGSSGGGSSSGGGASGGSSGTSGSGGSGSGSSSGSSSSSSSSDSSSSSSTSSTSSTIAGVYGDQYSLQVDVGRLPRIDEYAAASTSGADSGTPPPSDVRTVSYYLAGSAGQSTIAAAADTTVTGTGLVRTELDRAMSQFATTQGDSSSVNNTAAVLAPEVLALEFQYFDGSTWNTSWDSTQNSGLPQAVKISIALSDPGANPDNVNTSSLTSVSSISDAASQDPDSVYSLIVLVPARSNSTFGGGFQLIEWVEFLEFLRFVQRLAGIVRRFRFIGQFNRRRVLIKNESGLAMSNRRQLTSRKMLGRATCAKSNAERCALVLVIVLVAVAMLSLAAYTFSELMLTEHQSARVVGRQAQARELVNSGGALLQYYLAQVPDLILQAGGTFDNAAQFQGLVVADDGTPRGRGRVCILSPKIESGAVTGVRYGLDNESARININALVQWDKQKSGVGRQILMTLPGMDETIADAILDWIDDDDTPRENGAESDTYASLTPPYAPTNGPIATIEELLKVRGVTPQLLFGADANRNGIIDPGEEANAQLASNSGADPETNRGWAAYLTVHSKESNLQPDGTPKIDINGSDMQQLHDDLASVLDNDEWVNFILAYRLYGGSSGQQGSQQGGGQQGGGQQGSGQQGGGGQQGGQQGSQFNVRRSLFQFVALQVQGSGGPGGGPAGGGSGGASGGGRGGAGGNGGGVALVGPVAAAMPVKVLAAAKADKDREARVVKVKVEKVDKVLAARADKAKAERAAVPGVARVDPAAAVSPAEKVARGEPAV